MRFIASAIVILAGSLLWAAGQAVTWTHIGKGNLIAGKAATYGGVAIVAMGLVFMFLAHNANPQDKA